MNEGGPLEHPIESYISSLKPIFERYGVVLAYLYGSQARGTAGPFADVDVAVLFQPALARQERVANRLALHDELARVFGRSDLFLADLAGATPLLCDEVRREGLVISCADDALRVDFEVQALREFVDTEPLRRIRKQYLLERISQGQMGRYPKLQGRFSPVRSIHCRLSRAQRCVGGLVHER